MKRFLCFALLLCMLPACEGTLLSDGNAASVTTDPNNSTDPTDPTDPNETNPTDPTDPAWPVNATQQAPTSALYRLSRREFENTIVATFGIETLASSRLPPDVIKPFDTDQSTKEISSVFFDGFENVAF